ncbi:hypothetical protein LCGC14_1206470 [marine sediment metagenome]|uniref:Uncharacterized protein n=1 Tax=marine sediment metagenome TaxID=412755 RepID=A0A0F9M2P9_9ZZZZ
MIAGMRMRISVHSIGYGDDDEVGGAQTTGTLTIRQIPASIEYLKPSQLLLEQGGEIRRLARVLVQPGTLVIYERDELEIVGPPGHEDIGNKFRVESVSRTGYSPNDSRGRHLLLTCERIERSRDDRVGMQ